MIASTFICETASDDFAKQENRIYIFVRQVRKSALLYKLQIRKPGQKFLCKIHFPQQPAMVAIRHLGHFWRIVLRTHNERAAAPIDFSQCYGQVRGGNVDENPSRENKIEISVFVRDIEGTGLNQINVTRPGTGNVQGIALDFNAMQVPIPKLLQQKQLIRDVAAYLEDSRILRYCLQKLQIHIRAA